MPSIPEKKKNVLLFVTRNLHSDTSTWKQSGPVSAGRGGDRDRGEKTLLYTASTAESDRKLLNATAACNSLANGWSVLHRLAILGLGVS